MTALHELFARVLADVLGAIAQLPPVASPADLEPEPEPTEAALGDEDTEERESSLLHELERELKRRLASNVR